ncbi:MAG: 50S ribosomal protein L35 [Defluviitaleaceae bacterium]|nr:50S ribosomal protein L35 [Defluviitaleaceae bacterium]
MPKLKTKRAASKRFKVTGTGKVKYFKANKQHILGKKSPKRKMNLRKAGIVDETNMKNVKKMMPYE